MKYPKITVLVPQSEHFDESAITGEGVWLSTAHVSAIENQLDALATSSEKLNQTLEVANGSIKELNTTIESLNAAATTDKETISGLNSRISELETENKTLGAQSSGNGTTLNITEDPKPAENKNSKLTLNSSDHPLNQFAARRLAASTKK